MEVERWVGFVELINKPAVMETFVDILLCLVPIWVAVMIGLVIGWSWRPRWTGLVFLGLRSKINRFVWTIPPGFGARRVWLAFTALSAFSVGSKLWFNFHGRTRKPSAVADSGSGSGSVSMDQFGSASSSDAVIRRWSSLSWKKAFGVNTYEINGGKFLFEFPNNNMAKRYVPHLNEGLSLGLHQQPIIKRRVFKTIGPDFSSQVIFNDILGKGPCEESCNLSLDSFEHRHSRDTENSHRQKTDQIAQEEREMANTVGKTIVESLHQLIKIEDNELNRVDNESGG
ncbi:hypothetical protein BC332_15475 [Capsicum chinense]|nr:hypothetical protein BC332_15475 [Capsicum chinense]